MRTFIAIELNQAIQNTLSEIINHLKRLDCNVKWVNPQKTHLTLKFLGDIKENQLNPIQETLDKAIRQFSCFESPTSNLGAFPDLNRPRIVWLGLNDEQQKLSNLAAAVEADLEKIGFKKESRVFHPHITLGRIRNSKNLALLSKELKQFTLSEKQTQQINEVSLIKSTLTPSGPIYELLNTFPLQK